MHYKKYYGWCLKKLEIANTRRQPFGLSTNPPRASRVKRCTQGQWRRYPKCLRAVRIPAARAAAFGRLACSRGLGTLASAF